MGRITIYLEGRTGVLVRAAAKAAGVSQSRWVAEVVRERLRSQWPDSIRSLAGAWSDLPTAEQIRQQQPADVPRESLRCSLRLGEGPVAGHATGDIAVPAVVVYELEVGIANFTHPG